jgi:hypothetical protein
MLIFLRDSIVVLMDSIGFPVSLSIVLVGPKGYFRALSGY